MFIPDAHISREIETLTLVSVFVKRRWQQELDCLMVVKYLFDSSMNIELAMEENLWEKKMKRYKR